MNEAVELLSDPERQSAFVHASNASRALRGLTDA